MPKCMGALESVQHYAVDILCDMLLKTELRKSQCGLVIIWG